MESEVKLSFNLGTLERNSGSLESIKEGNSFYRILPPFGTNNRGSLFASFSIHWGFDDAEGNKVPVFCSYPTEKFCPICEQVFQAEDEMKTLQKEKESTRYKELAEIVSEYRADRGNYFNAINQEGRVVKLKLKKTATDALIARIKEAVSERRFDPVSLETGVWFKFSRTGKGFNTEYAVDFKRVYMTTADGEEVEKLDRTPLEAQMPDVYKALVEQYENPGRGGLAFDVHTLYKPLSSLEIKTVLETGTAPSRGRRRGQEESSLEVGPLNATAGTPTGFTPRAQTKPVEVPAQAAVAAEVTPKVAPVEAAPPAEEVSAKAKLEQEKSRLSTLLKKKTQ